MSKKTIYGTLIKNIAEMLTIMTSKIADHRSNRYNNDD